MSSVCLLIHGFGGSVAEVAPLAKDLIANGYLVSCPRLEGHTGNPADLRKSTYPEWIRSAEEALLTLQKESDSIHIIGFSMGGLIGIELAMKYKVRSLTTINTPIYYWNVRLIISNIFSDIRKRQFDNIRRYMSSSGSLPLSAVYNFLSLLYKTRRRIGNVSAPALIVQSLNDDTVRSSSARFIYDHLSSIDKQVKYYQRGGHVILLSDTAHEVIGDIVTYLGQIEKAERQ
jgi:carboxylesterase